MRNTNSCPHSLCVQVEHLIRYLKQQEYVYSTSEPVKQLKPGYIEFLVEPETKT